MNISKTKLLFIAAALATTNIATADNSKSYVAQDNSIESKICAAAANGSKIRMNSAVDQLLPTKMTQQKYELLANKLSCNGVNIADFAAQAGNVEVANKFKSYRTKNVEIRDIAATYKGSVIISS